MDDPVNCWSRVGGNSWLIGVWVPVLTFNKLVVVNPELYTSI